jgi:hypothetical protein
MDARKAAIYHPSAVALPQAAEKKDKKFVCPLKM